MGCRTRAIQLLLPGLVGLMLLGAGDASAETCTKTWTGTISGAWEAPGNWTGNSVPGSSDSVCIPAGTRVVTLSSAVDISSLSDAGSLTIGENGSLTAATTVDDTGGLVTLQGTDNCSVSDSATLQAADVTNGGTLELDHVGSCQNGTVTVAASGTLTSTGRIDLSGTAGPFSITGAITDEGTFTIGSGLSLMLPSTSSLTNAAGTIDVRGALAISGSYTQGDGVVAGSPITLGDGASVDFTGGGAAALSIGGGSTVGVSGTIAHDQTLIAQGVDECAGSRPATLNATGVLVNEGIIGLDHRGSCSGGAVTLNVPSGIANIGAIEITGATGPHSIVGQLFNGGALTIAPGLQLDATLVQTAGITTIGAGATLSQSTGSVELVRGKLTGAGTIEGSLDNYGGEVDLAAAPVTMSVTGEYTQGTNGSLAIYAGDVDVGQYSVLLAGAGVVLGGTVTIVPSQAYAASAAVGDSIAFLLYAGGRTGEVQSISSSPSLSAGRSFAASYDDAHGAVDAIVQQGPPRIILRRPAAGATYGLHQTVRAAYACADESGGTGVESCIGSTANGAFLPTSTLGSKTFTVTATNRDGLSATRIVRYVVGPPSNHFAVSRVSVRRNGIAKLRVALPGPGRLVIRERLRDRRSLILFTTHIAVQSAGTLPFSTGPVGREKRELAHIHRHRRGVLLTITYQPTGGRARTLVLRKPLGAPRGER